MLHDESAPSFGLPRCLRVPVAAFSIEALATFVGEVQAKIANRKGEPVAVKLRAFNRGFPAEPIAPLWRTELGKIYAELLFPEFQVWVHVDYRRYRTAYQRFGMAGISSNTFLDHIQNRRAERLRGYSHPFIRLCPVSRLANTSSGNSKGAEGIEVEYLRSQLASPEKSQALKARLSAYKVQYADPSDLTKMLDIAPGTFVLNGVRDALPLFFP